MNEMKATVYLTMELAKMMKIYYMRNSALPELDYVLDYFYASAGENLGKDEYPEDLAAEVYENLVALKHERKEIW
jgi:hypothetical protein